MNTEKKFRHSWCGFDLPKLESQLSTLEKKSEDPHLWDHPNQAQKLMKKISDLRFELNTWHQLAQRIDDSKELAELNDESLRPELEPEIEALEQLV
ncbi:MAG: PCRF domain-containing protein, partial [Chloroflexi bacterium]|nr:PCRF domain-containing protein [Chloroflexota bacterium]